MAHQELKARLKEPPVRLPRVLLPPPDERECQLRLRLQEREQLEVELGSWGSPLLRRRLLQEQPPEQPSSKLHLRPRCLVDPLLLCESRQLLLPRRASVLTLQRVLVPDAELKRSQKQMLEPPLLVASSHPHQEEKRKQLPHEPDQLHHKGLAVSVAERF